ncbi:MDR family MFS transporter [Niallia taxi]|uniref:DHA2 family efflux MFS transporter permease subunit n=1 Tax=Niallia taxi TaxID=2499688 RepID=A0A3S2X9A1_9BACI|nr:MDR family MFS transporter [Niallia taxi]MDK8642399.1 MDR family MFS transporter [Niallia taxi]MED4037257.1 MDR family MFS transporter [Niallia taxi]MED4054856.1 MDR family MFS transporter [Niallia taxi]MED4121132.1 MDR family MFS transporter [Niallia taxi]RVT63623.1 DHA2 family efflux MFS transporter permease subunit [Niallia taxi]
MSSKQTRLVPVMIALMLGIFVASLDNTIVATSMGSIIGDLGGMDKYVWVTSAYLVAEMAGMPIFGKLSDMYGRKKFFVFGILLFLAGSILCGMANTMIQLCIFRAIQGIGGSALMPIAFTIIWDVVPREVRGKMSGIFGAVFGLSSIAGPLLGSFITEQFDWRWIFFINIPIGIIALALIVIFYKESKTHTKQIIDWFGFVFLLGFSISLMFGLELGGETYPWQSWQIISLFILSVVCFIVFLLVEKRAKDPILPFNLFKERLYTTSVLTGMFYGGVFMVSTIYIPLYIQGVTGGTATNSGLLLLPMMVTSSVAAALGGAFANKFSYKSIMMTSGIIMAIGTFLLSTLDASTPRWSITIYMMVIGLGVGPSFSVLGMASLQKALPQQRGIASSTSNFLRSLGMTLGITVFGVIQRNSFTDNLPATMPEGGAESGSILSPEARAHIPADILKQITDVLSDSISTTFLWTFIPLLLSFVFILSMTKEKITDSKLNQQG